MSYVTYPCQRCGKLVTKSRGDGGAQKYCSHQCSAQSQPRPTRDQRFWTHVTRTDGCWAWRGAHKMDGYGIIRTGPRGAQRTEGAHRISWEIHNGPIPPGMAVLHHCDNPPCTNPAHLFLGTWGDNAADRDRKGRNVNLRGEAHGRAKLTEADVLEIRRRAPHESHTALAIEFGISRPYVSDLSRRLAWKHVE